MISPKKTFSKTMVGLFLVFTTYYLPPTTYLPALAQEPNYDRVNEIAKKLNCPTCAGINLADCRTLTCEQWRDQINDLVTQGYDDEDVLTYFTTRYGSQVLQEPPKSGSTLFLWVLPVTILLAGGVWLIIAVRRWSGPEPTPLVARPASISSTSDPSQPPGHYLSQVEKDLNLED
jgi:cytochrome c-type biogenesis protein CcmH